MKMSENLLISIDYGFYATNRRNWFALLGLLTSRKALCVTRRTVVKMTTQVLGCLLFAKFEDCVVEMGT